MPIESALLDGAPVRFAYCPKCNAEPFEPFLRGMVQRSYLWAFIVAWWTGDTKVRYCALICRDCKEIVGYE